MNRGEREVELGVATSHDDREATETLAWHAESRRRDGDHEAALSLACEALARDPGDVAARATAALAALDLGRDAELRRLLEALVARPAEVMEDGAGIGDSELDLAFAQAAPETDTMRDANALAFDAIRAAALDAPEGVVAPDPESPFHTRTMAALLERQGDRATADSIRVSLARREEGAPRDAAPGRRREDRIRILERWLERTRRGDA